MKKKELKCVICGANLFKDDSINKLICSECNTTHEIDFDNLPKEKKFHYRLTKIKILVAILVALYALYFFLRRII